MTKTELQRVAEAVVAIWWPRFAATYPQIGAIPAVKINSRLKTTAGRAFIEDGYIDLSYDLFSQYRDRFAVDTIPHELAHMVAYRLTGDAGHGDGWKQIVKQFKIATTRCHNMVNSRWEGKK